jgi:hypothetical protein
MKIIAVALITSLIALAAPRSVFAQETEPWRRVAESISLGTKVKVQTIEGKRVSGTLMRVDTTSLMLKKNTRLPEAAVVVPFDVVSNIEKDTGGHVNVAKAILIGAGVGAGALLTMFAIALQLD